MIFAGIWKQKHHKAQLDDKYSFRQMDEYVLQLFPSNWEYAQDNSSETFRQAGQFAWSGFVLICIPELEQQPLNEGLKSDYSLNLKENQSFQLSIFTEQFFLKLQLIKSTAASLNDGINIFCIIQKKKIASTNKIYFNPESSMVVSRLENTCQ